VSKTHPVHTLVVLVHGAWHSSMHWATLQRQLANLGVASLAIDLPGHGVNAPVPSGYLAAGQPGLSTEKSAAADITMLHAATALQNTLAELRTRVQHLVIVAHSAGGGPASLAGDRAPHLFDRLVYLSAFVPAARPRFTDYIDAPENASAVKLPMEGNAAALGAHRINALSSDPLVVETIRRAFLNDLPSDAGDGWRQFLHPDEPFEILTAPVDLSRDRWGRIPRTYIRLTEDTALPVTTQDLMITEADRVVPDAPFEVRSLPGGHSPFVTRPAELAAMLASVAVTPTAS
jgi:pimeloyl-ACP methyl ester carboxylesterase